MDNNFPRVILGLDVSTNCIGISIVEDNGVDEKPKIIAITQKSPRIPKKIKGIEALCLKKFGFDEGFLKNLNEYTDKKITDVVIEEPLVSSNNVNTVATLLKFTGMIADSVYTTLGIVPVFISSYDARTYSFPELITIRKFNKQGKVYPLSHIKNAIKKNNIVLFGAYPYDVDKKTVMMNMVNDTYFGDDLIPWEKNKYDELKKENYDACDALICALAYVNINRHGISTTEIVDSEIEENDDEYIVKYTTSIWNKKFPKTLILPKNNAE